MRLAALVVLSASLAAGSVAGQQTVRVKVDGGAPELGIDIPAQI